MYQYSLTRSVDPPSSKSAGRGPHTSVKLVPRDPNPRVARLGSRELQSVRSGQIFL